MHIIFISASAELGGAEYSLLDIINIISSNIKKTVILPRSGPLEQVLQDRNINNKIIQYPEHFEKLSQTKLLYSIFSLLIHFSEFIKYIKNWNSVLKSYSDNIVLYCNGVKSYFFSIILKILFRNKIRVIWHIRTYDKPIIRLLYKSTQIFADTIITNSLFVKNGIKGFNSNNITVIYNGIDTNIFVPKPVNIDIRKKYSLNKDDFVIGSIGALVNIKGYIESVRMLKPILTIPNVYWMIVGGEIYDTYTSRNYKSELINIIKHNGLSDKIILTGFQNNVLNYIHTFNVFLHYPTQPEGFGRVLIENMSCQKLVITRNFGSYLEIIDTNKNGILVNNREDVRYVIKQYIKNPNDFYSIQKNARQKVVEQFHKDILSRKINKIFESYIS